MYITRQKKDCFVHNKCHGRCVKGESSQGSLSSRTCSKPVSVDERDNNLKLEGKVNNAAKVN